MKNKIRYFLYDYLGIILACKVDPRKKFLENGLCGSYFLFFVWRMCYKLYSQNIQKNFWYEDLFQPLDFTKDGAERQKAIAAGWKYHMDIATSKKTFQNVKAGETREWLPLFMFKEYIPTQNILDPSLDALIMSFRYITQNVPIFHAILHSYTSSEIPTSPFSPFFDVDSSTPHLNYLHV